MRKDARQECLIQLLCMTGWLVHPAAVTHALCDTPLCVEAGTGLYQHSSGGSQRLMSGHQQHGVAHGDGCLCDAVGVAAVAPVDEPDDILASYLGARIHTV